MNYNKKYWSEGEFTTQSGEKYTGYVGIKDGKAYIFDNEEPLIIGDSYITNINKSEHFIDRVLASELKLPYSKSDVQFAANDFFYTSTVIDIIDKLQANNDYIFRNNILSDTTLPAVPECTIFSSKDKPVYYYQYRDEKYNLCLAPSSSVKPSGGKITVNGVSYDIAMMPNYKFTGSTQKVYNKSVTADQAYKECENSTVYSKIPYIAIRNELANAGGGILKRYNFREKGFSGVTKTDPYFYSTIKSETEYYINKKDPLILRPTDKVDSDAVVLYRNPAFKYDELKMPMKAVGGVVLPKNVYADIIGNNSKNYTLIPLVRPCSHYRYVYTTQTNITRYGDYQDTYLDIKNKPEFKALTYTGNGKTNYIPKEYMTADDAEMDYRNYSSSLKSPLFDKSENMYEIKDINDNIFYIKGDVDITGVLRAAGIKLEDVKYVSNPSYRSKSYNISANTTAAMLYEDITTNVNLKYYEFIPHIESFEHSVIEKEATFDFDKVTNAEICVTDVLNDKAGRYASSLIFLLTKKQIGIIRFKEYIDDLSANYNNSLNPEINFKSGSNIIIIDKVDPADNNSLAFKNLTSIKVYKDNLYIVDEDLNMVLHYDIGYLLNTGTAGEGGSANPFSLDSIKLLNTLQGDGTKDDKVYFAGPHYVNADDDYVYVVDRGNKCVKVFSHSLNYVKNLQNGYFAQHDIQAVACNPYSFRLEDGTILPKNSVWIFSVLSNRFFLSILIDDKVVYYGQIEALKISDDSYTWNEEIRSVRFSTANSNYYYFSTSKRVYKFHASTPLWPFASLSYFKQHSLNSALVWNQLNYKWNKIPSLYETVSDETSDTKLTWGYEAPIASAEILNNKAFALCGYDYYDKITSTVGGENIYIDKQFKGDLIFHFGVLYDTAEIAKFIRDNSSKFKDGLSFDTIPSGDKIKMTKSVALFTYIEPDSYINAISDTMFKSYPQYKITENIGNEYVNPLTFNKLLYQVIYNLMQIKEQIFGKFKGAANSDGVVVYDAIIMDSYIDELKLAHSSNYFVHNNEILSITINRIFEDILSLQENIIKMMQTSFMSSQSFVNSTTKII